jgi:hypothetical protein
MAEVNEGFFQVGDETVVLSGLYDDFVNVDFQVVPDLPLETGMHTTLVGAPVFFNLNNTFT